MVHKFNTGAAGTILKDRTLTDLSRVSGIGVSTLHRILNNQRTPNVILFHTLAKALKMSMDELFSRLYRTSN